MIKNITIIISFLFVSGVVNKAGAQSQFLSGVPDEQQQSKETQGQDLIKILKDKDLAWSDRKSAAAKLRNYSAAVDSLLKGLTSPNSETRALAAYALEGKGQFNKDSCEAIILRLIKDKSPVIRISAIKALGSIHKNEFHSKASIVARGNNSSTRQALIDSANNDKNQKVKKIAEDTLKALEEHSPTPLDLEILSYDTGVTLENQDKGEVELSKTQHTVHERVDMCYTVNSALKGAHGTLEERLLDAKRVMPDTDMTIDSLRAMDEKLKNAYKEYQCDKLIEEYQGDKDKLVKDYQSDKLPNAQESNIYPEEIIYITRTFKLVPGGETLEAKIYENAGKAGGDYNNTSWQVKQASKGMFKISAVIPLKAGNIIYTFIVDRAKHTVQPLNKAGKAAFAALRKHVNKKAVSRTQTEEAKPRTVVGDDGEVYEYVEENK